MFVQHDSETASITGWHGTDGALKVWRKTAPRKLIYRTYWTVIEPPVAWKILLHRIGAAVHLSNGQMARTPNEQWLWLWLPTARTFGRWARSSTIFMQVKRWRSLAIRVPWPRETFSGMTLGVLSPHRNPVKVFLPTIKWKTLNMVF